ncbi:decapping endonuclease targeting mRNA [Coemansia sp. RSA 1365]|nr:decapping endonuclease targeting mRNA [Coemansia sp. RSA 1365]
MVSAQKSGLKRQLSIPNTEHHSSTTDSKQARIKDQLFSSEEGSGMRAPVVRFGVHPLSKYSLACPQFSEPRELVSFSYDSNRKACMDNRELKYYYPPQLNPPPSLFCGFEKQIKRDHTRNEHIDGLLSALTHIRQQNEDRSVLLRETQADFVMYRGMLTRIFVTPYSLRDAWSMNATKVGSTIYIEDNITSENVAGRLGSSEDHQKMMYGGYRFETLCVIDTPPAELSPEDLNLKLQTRADEVVNTNLEYCSVFRTRLGGHSVISGAEVDCIEGVKPSSFPSRQYRELKTVKLLDSERAQSSFERFKLLKFWAQSFIAGIPTVTVGFRDDSGVLRGIQDFKTQDIPRMVKNKPRMWKPNVCMNFADKLLHFIKSHVVEEGPEMQYRIEYDPESQEIRILSLGQCEPFLTAEYMSVMAA